MTENRAGEALTACRSTFQRHLYLPDPGHLFVALATVAINTGERGDPLWVLLVGPPGSGKTEVLMPLVGRPGVELCATLTEASLLSGTPQREKAEDAHGGLLRRIGPGPGVLLCKDFGSILAMSRDARSSVLAALREVYDGSWTRHLGTDGGRTFSWEGKVGLIGGVTPAIDTHHAVMAALGERFMLYRLPPIDPDAQAHRALDHLGHEREMRRDLAKAAAIVLDSVDGEALAQMPSSEVRAEIVNLSTLAVKARSVVERDPYNRDVNYIPESEAPARFALVLLRLWNGLRGVGVGPVETRRIVAKAAVDSIPEVRQRVLRTLVNSGSEETTTEIARLIGYPVTTVRRTCEDLAAHSLVTQSSGGIGKADHWQAAELTLQRWPRLPEKAETNGSVPEKAGNHSLSLCTEDDFSGKVRVNGVRSTAVTERDG